jgi:hypothetical protein
VTPIRLKLIITVAAALLLIVHIQHPKLLPSDAATLGLAFCLILPWLSDVIESAKLPGGWEFKFRQVKEEQARQGAEIAMLKFLVTHFVTDDELVHLTKLAGTNPFTFTPSTFFEAELRRLLALRLLERLPKKGVRSLFEAKDDVRNHLRITDLGRDYLRLRHEAEAAHPTQAPETSPASG